MNKKQLVVAWVIGIIISLIFLGCILMTYESALNSLLLAMMGSTPILIIGSLLIYTLRDKKKTKI